MAYNHGREERKWRIWKEAEEKILRDCGVPESTIEEIRIYDRACLLYTSHTNILNQIANAKSKRQLRKMRFQQIPKHFHTV